jgi:2-iminoacetate synthase ThiH
MTRQEILAVLEAADPLAAAPATAPGGPVTWTRDAAPADWLVDGDLERPVAEHEAAHAAGRPSEAAVAYGAGTTPQQVADRLDALAALARRTGLLRAVCPVPGEGSSARPGSWGVEDMTVIAAARLALPAGVRVRPHWRRLGPATCQVATAFGADDWVIPDGDPTDPAALAAAAGREAVAR